MRSALAVMLLLLAGCPLSSVGSECNVDQDCSDGTICARDGQCMEPSNVRPVRATWTLRGVPANNATCAGRPDLFIEFWGSRPGLDLSFSPVPCATGTFFIDRLPLAYDRVKLGSSDGGVAATATIDAAGNALVDLAL